MKQALSILLIMGFASICFPQPVLADGGGWPTSTPTITPTITPLSPGVLMVTPPVASVMPDAGTTGLITPPVITPPINAAGTPYPVLPTPNSLPPESNAPVITPVAGSSTIGRIACWPLAIVALLVGLALFSWIQKGMKVKHE